MTRTVSANGNIERSAVITGDGNNVTMNFGGEFTLALERRQFAGLTRRRLQRRDDVLPLLAPDADILPFVGRAVVLDELARWATSEADVSVQTLIARAGAGKTRLAIELSKLLDGKSPRSPGDWVAGFVRPADLAHVVDRLATQHVRWAQPTLLVIDYAAAVHGELARWLDRLVDDQLEGKLRFLLLERDAPETFGWWRDLTLPRQNRGVTRRDLFVDPDTPLRLSDLEQGQVRRALLEAALHAAAAISEKKGPAWSVPAPGDDPAFDEALNSPRFGNPLNLAMAGVIAAEQGAEAALALRRLDAARFLGARELARLVRLGEAAKIPSVQLEHAVGFNGLAGGLHIATLRRDLNDEMAAMDLGAPPAQLADLLMQELPLPVPKGKDAAEPRLDTIQPDLVGEAVIIEALLTGPPDREVSAAKVVERAYSLTGSRAADALMRLIQDYGHALEDPGANEEERRIAAAVLKLLSKLLDAIPDTDIARLETLVDAFPKRTTVLRETAAKQTHRLASLWHSVAEAADHDEEVATFARSHAAGWLNNLSNRLTDLGQTEAARASAQEAVDLYRKLSLAQPGAFTASLALSINNLAATLNDLGQHEVALATAQEAVGLYRDLAEANPDAIPLLAMAVNNVASLLSSLGDREGALAAGEEAVDLYRRLAAAEPERYTIELATALNNIAAYLGDLAQRETALAAARESVDLRRRLAAARPDSFMPSLASGLNNLANLLSEQGEPDEALAAAQEAVVLWRSLSAARPAAFLPRLGTALNNLASRLSALSHREAALAAAEESVEIWRSLAASTPAQFSSQLAGSLSNLAIRLGSVGRDDDALAAIGEAVDHYRILASTRPAAYVPDLARSLSVLADRLEMAGRMEEALEADRESVSVLLPYLVNRPRVFTGPMATYLGDYIRRAGKAGTEPDSSLVEQVWEILQHHLVMKSE